MTNSDRQWRTSSAGAGRAQQLLIWILGLSLTGVMLGLGLWQMTAFRAQGREALIARIHEPPVALSSVAVAGTEPGDAYGRTVETTGTYLPDHQLLLPYHRDSTQLRVLTALRLPDGSLVPVVRGVLSEGATAPPSPVGEVRARGVFLPSEGEPDQELPRGQLGSVRLPRLAQIWVEPMAPGFMVLDQDSAAAQGLAPAEVQLPNSAGHARNQGYALQWWIFAAAALAATIKLSRDARTSSGFMSSRAPSVDEPAKSGDKPGQLSTTTPPDHAADV